MINHPLGTSHPYVFVFAQHDQVLAATICNMGYVLVMSFQTLCQPADITTVYSKHYRWGGGGLV